MEQARGGVTIESGQNAKLSKWQVVGAARGERWRWRNRGCRPDMGKERMAPRTDRTTRIPSGVASPVTTKHAAKGSVFVNLGKPATYVEDG